MTYRRSKSPRYMLFTTDSIIRVRWRFDDCPPNLRQGQRIAVYGKLATFELGNRATIEHALTIRVKKPVFKRLLSGLFDKIGLPVSAYDDWKGPLSSTRIRKERAARQSDLPEWMEGMDKE